MTASIMSPIVARDTGTARIARIARAARGGCG